MGVGDYLTDVAYRLFGPLTGATRLNALEKRIVADALQVLEPERRRALESQVSNLRFLQRFGRINIAAVHESKSIAIPDVADVECLATLVYRCETGPRGVVKLFANARGYWATLEFSVHPRKLQPDARLIEAQRGGRHWRLAEKISAIEHPEPDDV